jgi:hypothetical protein
VLFEDKEHGTGQEEHGTGQEEHDTGDGIEPGNPTEP